MTKEFKRQLIHILLGVLYLSVIYFFEKEAAITILLLFFAVGSFISYSHKHLKPIVFLKEIIEIVERDKEAHIPGKAALSFTLGVLLATIVFYSFDKLIILGAVIALTFGDGFSTIIGKEVGKLKTPGNKTIEGTIGGIIAGTIALGLFFHIEIAFAAAIFAMLAEYIPINDNYTIPLVTGTILILLV